MPALFVYWHWLAVGGLMVVAEMVAPGIFLLWLGLAAVATGLLLLAWPALGWPLQLVAFAVFAFVSVWAGRRLGRPRPGEGRHGLNQPGARFMGQVVTLAEPLPDGRGRLRLGDGWWTAEAVGGETLPAGTRVRVVGIAGTVVKVESVAA